MNQYGAPVPVPSDLKQGFVQVTDTTRTEVLAAPGHGLVLVVTAIVIDNSHATSKCGVNVYSGDTKIWGPIPAPAAGGAAILPIALICRENEAFRIELTAGVDTISVSACGYRTAKWQ
jgi:hypothetical protein